MSDTKKKEKDTAKEIEAVAEASKEIMTSNEACVHPGCGTGSRGSEIPKGNKKS